MDNYVEDPYPMQNFITIRLPLSPPKYAKNAHQVSRLVLFLIIPSAYSRDRCTDFYAQYVKWRIEVHPKRNIAHGARMCLWDLENKILYFDPSPKKEIWGQFSTRLRIFRLKNLTMGMLTCKWPIYRPRDPTKFWSSFVECGPSFFVILCSCLYCVFISIF